MTRSPLVSGFDWRLIVLLSMSTSAIVFGSGVPILIPGGAVISSRSLNKRMRVFLLVSIP
jgi:hypothetical protein